MYPCSKISETLAEVRFQGLLHHTTSWLCKYLKEVFKVIDFKERHTLELISNWVAMTFSNHNLSKNFRTLVIIMPISFRLLCT